MYEWAVGVFIIFLSYLIEQIVYQSEREGIFYRVLKHTIDCTLRMFDCKLTIDFIY